jgi:hypothetical protein
MSVANNARRVGVTPQPMSHSIARGEVVPEPNGLIDVAEADTTYGRRRVLPEGERARRCEAVARREQAIVTRTTAQVMIIQRKVKQVCVLLAERYKAHVEINATTSALHTYLAAHHPSSPLLREAIGSIRYALKATRV